MTNNRYVKVSAVQCGAASLNIEENIRGLEKAIDKVAIDQPDFILFSELATTPYFACLYDDEYFKWADTIPGEITERIGKKAKEYGAHIILPLFERDASDKFFNSAVVIGPDGLIINGSLPNGQVVNCYRKVHIPASYDEVSGELRSDEKYYYSPGSGFPIFKTDLAKIGILICWDKRFTEGWRSLALGGAEIIFNPIATRGKWREETFPLELRVMALYNQVFVVGCAKAGAEQLDRKRDYVGGSFIIDPNGYIIKSSHTEEWMVTSAVVDLGEIEVARNTTPIYRDRRPELYSMLTKYD